MPCLCSSALRAAARDRCRTGARRNLDIGFHKPNNARTRRARTRAAVPQTHPRRQRRVSAGCRVPPGTKCRSRAVYARRRHPSRVSMSQCSSVPYTRATARAHPVPSPTPAQFPLRFALTRVAPASQQWRLADAQGVALVVNRGQTCPTERSSFESSGYESRACSGSRVAARRQQAKLDFLRTARRRSSHRLCAPWASQYWRTSATY